MTASNQNIHVNTTTTTIRAAATTPTSLGSSFPSDVLNWLDAEDISWTYTKVPIEWEKGIQKTTTTTIQKEKNRATTMGHSTKTVMIDLFSKSNEDLKIVLHLIPTPTNLKESLPPNAKKVITESIIHQRRLDDNDDDGNNDTLPQKVVHLHEDVWISKNAIVKHRILAQIGAARQQKRIYARKTICNRINATFAMKFLNNHHLWGATKAKYYYGLFLPHSNNIDDMNNDDTVDDDSSDELVAVATFSPRRKIKRGLLKQSHDDAENELLFHSHELLRFCSTKDCVVVGGISKLLKAFIRDVSPDDIVTVVDRDWGDGSGWHTTGFDTVHVMAPIVMVVNRNEPGVRRHLVGAGIRHSDPSTSSKTGEGDKTKKADSGGRSEQGRMGIPLEVYEKLQNSSSSDESLRILSQYSYYPVYDSGVERLFKIVHSSSMTTGVPSQALWDNSKPKYATSYYSDNAGIMHLLEQAAIDCEENFITAM